LTWRRKSWETPFATYQDSNENTPTDYIFRFLFISLPACVAESGYLTGGPNSGHSTVIVFVHGYRGSNASCGSTIDAKSLPSLIGSDKDLASFADVYSFEYSTNQWDPKAQLPPAIASTLLETVHTLRNVDGKKNVLMVCHSMGGLIAQALRLNTNLFQYLRLWQGVPRLTYLIRSRWQRSVPSLIYLTRSGY
jgi:pimeloyl-ACP methyl ester carboxylesterase